MKTPQSPFLSPVSASLVIALALTGCAGQPAVPQTAEEAVAALEASAAAPAEGEDLVCRSEVVTGTNFKRRTCRTAEEWASLSRYQRSAAEQLITEDREQAGVNSAADSGTPGGF